MNPETHRRARGYSMVELLIVMSIIALVAALMMPAVRAAKERTKSMTCLNRLRQAGSAAMQYASDHGHFPHSSHFEYWADWGESLIPYMVFMNGSPVYVPGDAGAYGLYKIQGTGQHLDHEVSQGRKDAGGNVIWPGYNFFTCPAAPQPAPTQHIYGHDYSANEYLMPSNNWRNWIPGGADSAATLTDGSVIFPPAKPGEIERPGSLILICDAGESSAIDAATGAVVREALDTLPGAIDDIINDFVNNPADASSRGALPVPTSAANDTDEGAGAGWPVYYRHNGRCNALMADGHVESFSNGDLQRRNFVARGKTKRWGGGSGFVEAYYP
jgi:prepilin-type processing-associated H-X9-DG protein/prepilin-type N-terminal cleavage/methylation domain-containing protein